MTATQQLFAVRDAERHAVRMRELDQQLVGVDWRERSNKAQPKAPPSRTGDSGAIAGHAAVVQHPPIRHSAPKRRDAAIPEPVVEAIQRTREREYR